MSIGPSLQVLKDNGTAWTMSDLTSLTTKISQMGLKHCSKILCKRHTHCKTDVFSIPKTPEYSWCINLGSELYK